MSITEREPGYDSGRTSTQFDAKQVEEVGDLVLPYKALLVKSFRTSRGNFPLYT